MDSHVNAVGSDMRWVQERELLETELRYNQMNICIEAKIQIKNGARVVVTVLELRDVLPEEVTYSSAIHTYIPRPRTRKERRARKRMRMRA